MMSLSSATSVARRSRNGFNQRHLSSSPKRNEPNDEPWWSLVSLHKRVATVLATSLPDSYKSDLYQSLTASLNQEDSHKSHSVNEAIVSAQAREASAKHKSSAPSLKTDQMQLEWLEKQKKLEEEIEQRALEKAQERMQAELLLMQQQMKLQEDERRKQEKEDRKKFEIELQRKVVFEQWKNDVQNEKEQQQYKKQQRLDDDTVPMSVDSSDESEKEVEVHPILGQELADLSYKRIHLMSAATLASLPVYEKQRAYRHDRAQLMAKDKLKTLWMGVPGVISLMEDESGKLSILDGQHRVGMMAILNEEQRKAREVLDTEGSLDGQSNELARLDLQSVLVEIFPQRSRDETVLTNEKDLDDKAAIFTEINKAEPIKLLDLPGVATKQTRTIIDHAASHFHNAFPAMFSPSQKCRAPHLNLDNLRDALFASDIIKREKIGSGGELVKWMNKKNSELKAKYTVDSNIAENEKNSEKKTTGTKVRVSLTALKKATLHDFFLGLDSTWLYN